MRSPTDLPRKKSRPRLSRNVRVLLVVLGVVLVGLALSLRGLANFWTDYLWYDALGQRGVWGGVLASRIVLGVLFTGIFFVVLWVNLFIADKIAPPARPAGPEEEFVERYQELIGRRTGLVRILVSLLFALIAGVGVSAQWRDWLLFINAESFGINDPLFGMDVGFYVFRLPFLTFLVDWAFAALIIVTIVTTAAHYLNGGIRFQTTQQRVTPQVKAHLSVLLGLMALLRAAGYWLNRYELTTSTRGTVDGALYTDVNAQLPAINLLILISLFAFVLLLVNIRRRGWVLPIIAVGLWALVALVAGTAYPAFVQRFQVIPAESTKEAPYLEWNIEATRQAYGLSDINVYDFDLQQNLRPTDLEEYAGTIRNVRLLDPNVLLPTFQRLQGVRAFYRFDDLDVDRYNNPNGSGKVPVVLSARELNQNELPQDTWENRHLTYTHGYGMALAPANTVSAGGRPDFALRDLPPQGIPELTRPEVYFGENLPSYSIVNTNREEVNYVSADGTLQTTSYDGAGGVEMGSLLRRAAFALRFSDINPLISSFVTPESRILYIRDVRERVQLLAPFLRFDADPYPVVLDGRILWVIDGYTTSDRYPYAQRANPTQLPVGSGLATRFNYARNSVKGVVDAYDGTVAFYVIDEGDPIVRAWRSAFPELFRSIDQLPAGLDQHLRYPEDLFRVQTVVWGRYHINDPIEFYSQSDAWSVAQNPQIVAGLPNQAPQTTNAQGQLGSSQELRQDPYYQVMSLPNPEDPAGKPRDPAFVLMRSFVPFSQDDSRKELVAFMTANGDPGNYGQLEVWVMPRSSLPDGPALVAATINANETIARELSLLDQRGSTVIQGNLLLLPIRQSILYVRPLYVQASGSTAVPELKQVIVTYGDNAYMKPTLEEALAAVFSGQTVQGPGGEDSGTSESGEPIPGTTTTTIPGQAPTTPPESARTYLAAAQVAFAQADEALRSGDLATYQRKIEEARRLVEAAVAAEDAAALGVVPPETTDTTVAAASEAPATTTPPTTAPPTTTTTTTPPQQA